MKILIDTNVIIDILQPEGDKTAEEIEKRKPDMEDLENLLENNQCMVSILSLLEVYRGCSSDPSMFQHYKTMIEKFKRRGLKIVPVKARHSRLGLQLFEEYLHSHPPSKKKDGIIVDRIIAAQAIIEGARLWTENIKDFRYIDGIELYKPFEGL